MTVTTEDCSIVVEIVTAGVPVPLNFSLHAEQELEVYIEGTDVDAHLSVDYTVVLSPPTYTTAQLIPLSGLVYKADGRNVVINRATPARQPLGLPANTKLPEPNLERQYDRGAMRDAEIRRVLGLAVTPDRQGRLDAKGRRITNVGDAIDDQDAVNLRTLAAYADGITRFDDFSRRVQEYTATEGQTAFTVTDGYTVGLLAVFSNGVRLAEHQFSATDGATFTLYSPAEEDDNIVSIAFGSFRVADHYSRSETDDRIKVLADWYFNPTMFAGATPRAKLQAAIDAAAAAGGGTVRPPAGVIPVDTTVFLRPKVEIEGNGEDGDKATTLLLAGGVNLPVIRSFDYAAHSLAGGYDNPDGMKLTKLRIDHNRSLNPDFTVNCVELYGARLHLERVSIKDAAGVGLATRWGQYGEQVLGMEGTFRNIKIDTCGKSAWVFAGPHDSHLDHIVVIDAGQHEDNVYNAFDNLANYGNARVFNMHCWHRSTAVNRVAFQVASSGANEFVACHFEGGRAQVFHRGIGDAMIGCRFYAYAGPNGGSHIVFGGSQNRHIGCYYDAAGINTDCSAVQFGHTGQAASGNQVEGAYFLGFRSRTPINFANSSGLNRVVGRGYAAPGGNTTVWTGGAHVSDEIDYVQDGTSINFRRPRAHANFADDTAAAAGGVPLLGLYRRNSDNALVVRTV